MRLVLTPPRYIWMLGVMQIGCDRCGRDAVPDDSHQHSDSIVNTDEDGDGYRAGVDCDDRDPGVYPGAVELCDSVDNDCDDLVDNVLSQNDDCDGVDDDCDGLVDEDELVVFENLSGEVSNFSPEATLSSEDSPLLLALNEPGDLRVCGGELRYIQADISASVNILPANTSLPPTVSSGLVGGTVIAITGESPSSVRIEGLTIRDGVGDCWISRLSRMVGGGVCCIGEHELSLVDVTLVDNSADSGLGGGLFVQQCATNMKQSVVMNNSAAWSGGGIFAYGASIEIEDTLIDGNMAMVGSGLGMFSYFNGVDETPASTQILDSVVTRGASYSSVYVGQYASFECAASASNTEAGVFGNEVLVEGAVTLTYYSYGFTGTNCDMGSAVDGNDNSGPDVYGDDDVPWTANIGNDATFSCSIEQVGCTIE